MGTLFGLRLPSATQSSALIAGPRVIEGHDDTVSDHYLHPAQALDLLDRNYMIPIVFQCRNCGLRYCEQCGIESKMRCRSCNTISLRTGYPRIPKDVLTPPSQPKI